MLAHDHKTNYWSMLFSPFVRWATKKKEDEDTATFSQSAFMATKKWLQKCALQ